MRIEEMRSGRAYLGKRLPTSEIATFEPRELRHAFTPAHGPRAHVEKRPEIESDLDKNEWSVVSFNGVEAGGLTYRQATRLMDVLGDNAIPGLCIITDLAAMRIGD